MKQLILYDLDGTLVDTRQDIIRTVEHMLAQMQRPPLPQRMIAGHVGKGLPYLIQQCLGTEDPAQVEEGLRLYRAYYREHMLDHSRLYPGVRSVLEHFTPRPQVVMTNKSEWASKILLKELRIDHHFQAVVGGDSGFAFKPDPAGTLAILARYQAAPQDVLLIGDSLIDVETGRNAGVPTVILSHGFGHPEELAAAKPDHMAQDFEELLSLGRRLGW